MVILFMGVLVGASLANIVIGKQIDYLHMSNESLRRQLSISERELQSLKESLVQKKKQVVTGIEVEICFAGEKLTGYEESVAALTVEERVEEWLEVIKGQDLDDINYMLIPQIIDGREIDVDGRKLGLKVKLVVIAKSVVVYLEVKPIPSNSG